MAFRSAPIAILENVARLTRAIAEPSATGSRDDVRPSSEVGHASDDLNTARRSRDRRLRWALIVSALIVFAAVRAWRGQDSSTPFLPALPPGAALTDNKLASAPRLSIVVLPFANLSGDPEQDTLAGGLTDDLTTDLTHLPDSFVIGRSAATAYRGKRADLRRLGRHLGVRYALEGSVRRAGETITVNAQLISTETGADVWADRLEGESSRLAELQTELVSRLANSLKVP